MPASILVMLGNIHVGSRVYIRIAICGEPGCVTEFDRNGRAKVFWPDMPELARTTTHSLDSLVVDEAFCVRQYDLFGEQAA